MMAGPTPTPTPADFTKVLYWYSARLQPTQHDPTGVVDGDTMHVTVDFGFYTYLQKSMRVANVNAPELKTAAGPASKQYAIDWFNTHAPQGFYVHTHLDPDDKYGRILAMIYAPSGECYNDDVVNAGMAVPFDVQVY
jgi:endonuclease YncB( thermonuclease family)